MSLEKSYCEKCHEFSLYNITESEIKSVFKDEEIFHIEKKAICKNCKEELFVDSIMDYNMQSLYDAYREKNGLISLTNILEILEKYKIGKRPLSLLLGWGEITLSRYCEGHLPTKQYSDILKDIYQNSNTYLTLLEKNKSNLPSIATYKKSKAAVEALIKLENTTKTKLENAAEYLLRKLPGNVTALSLQKGLYYVQSMFSIFYGKFIFDDDCKAWVHGPVYGKIYHKYKEYRYFAIDSPLVNVDDLFLSNEEKVILDTAVIILANFGPKQLEEITHNEKPWLDTRGDLPKDASSDRIIPKELIAEYFASVKDEYSLVNPSDMLNYIKSKANKLE